MMIPIRCFTCGKLIGHKYEEYQSRIKKGEDQTKVLDDLEIRKYCCRRMMISQPDLFEEVKEYPR
jgi:DNA-directed RNA polymerase subunit N